MKNYKFDITELFMAQASRDRRFYGTIKRLTDAKGNKLFRQNKRK